MRNFLIALTRNPVSLLGVAIVTSSAVLTLTLFVLETFGLRGSPYIGIIAYLILPAILVLGLILIPIGIIRERRRARRAVERGEAPPRFPVIDLNRGTTRYRVVILLLLTGVNVVILSTATYKGVEVMDSTEFCGTTCHSVMQPEYTTYARSPHSRVHCVSCHIGPGADWFVKSKLSGAWQVVATTFELYPRPIPTPVHNLRPARETCEQCHWPTKFVGDKLKVVTRYADDEANTELKTVLLLRVGGLQGGTSHGIHWHVDPNIQIRYLSDEKRETIYDVELTQAGSPTKIYRIPDSPDTVEGEWRVMDCVDCHNRPSHVFRLPHQEVDIAIQEGRLPRSLPYLRREALRLIEKEYTSHDEARSEIPAALTAFYRENYPDADGATVAEAGRVLAELHNTNVFPSMNVRWGTYPDHIGHESDPGCFRCHDEEHATEDGELISQDCFTCHGLLAMEEEQPEILDMLQP